MISLYAGYYLWMMLTWLVLFVQAFKFVLAVGQQMSTLRRSNLALQTDLEEAKKEVSQTKQRVEPLVKAAQDSEEGRKAALVELG